METSHWIKGPIGLDAAGRVTMTGCRTALIMIPTMAAGHRVTELTPLIEADHRIQTVFTVPRTTESWHGVEEYVRGFGGLVLPWHQTVQHTFDLVLTASHREIDRVRGNVLVLPHGAGNVMSRKFSRKSGGAARPTTGLDRELLTFRGRVIPAAIALTHESELEALRHACPEAVPTGVVAGDICLDRMVASRPLREQYRQALGVHEDQALVTISSTWSPDSTFGQHIELYQRLLSELSGTSSRVAAVLHPNIWTVHGSWQVRAWLADCVRAGLLVIPPERGWQATMIASDVVLGDKGSTTLYAAALGKPVLTAAVPDALWPGSLADVLYRTTSAIDHGSALRPQLTRAIAAHSGANKQVAELITSRPGKSAAILRATMYRLLGLAEPARAVPVCAVPLPQVLS